MFRRIRRFGDLVPTDFETRRPFILYVNARRSPGLEQPSAIVWLQTSRVFDGEESSEMRLSLGSPGGSVSFTARLRLRAERLPEDAQGKLAVPVEVDYEVSAALPHRRVAPHRGRVRTEATVLVDGDRVYVLELAPNIPVYDVPGARPYTAFEIHLGAWGGD